MTEGTGRATGGRRVDRAALAIAAAMFILAAVIGWDVSRLSNIASYARIGPQTVPYLIALCLAGLGAWTVIEALRGDFPPREQQELRPVYWIVAGLIGQLVLLRLAGFSIATGVLFGCVAYGLGRKPLWLGIPAGILLAMAVWIIFARGLSLNLPGGPLEAVAVVIVSSIVQTLALGAQALWAFTMSFA